MELRTLSTHEYQKKEKEGRNLLNVIYRSNFAQFECTWFGDGCFEAGLLRLDPQKCLTPQFKHAEA